MQPSGLTLGVEDLVFRDANGARSRLRPSISGVETTKTAKLWAIGGLGAFWISYLPPVPKSKLYPELPKVFNSGIGSKSYRDSKSDLGYVP